MIVVRNVFRLKFGKSKEAVATHLETLKAGLDWKARTENLPFSYQRNET